MSNNTDRPDPDPADFATRKEIRMDGVVGGDTDCAVMLAEDDDTGCLVVRGFNEAGYACVDIDLVSLLRWIFLKEPNACRYTERELAAAFRKYLE